MVPDKIPDPVLFTWHTPYQKCGEALSDGTGHIALAGFEPDFLMQWQVLAPDGTLGRAFGGDMSTPLIPQAQGWDTLTFSTQRTATGGGFHVITRRTIAPDGTPLAQTVLSDGQGLSRIGFDLAQDPEGGSLVTMLEVQPAPAGTPPPALVMGQRFATSGAALWPADRLVVGTVPQLAAPADRLACSGVSTQGESLTLWSSRGALSLAWRDRGGNTVAEGSGEETIADAFGSSVQLPDPYSEPFGPRPRAELFPLIDGSLAIRINGFFQRTIGHLATTTSALPRWLADRSGWTFRFSRSARGYAVLPPADLSTGDEADCAQPIDLVSATGRVCGRVTLHTAHAQCGQEVVDQGWDGTVVQSIDPQLLVVGAVRDRCSFVIWPQMLR